MNLGNSSPGARYNTFKTNQLIHWGLGEERKPDERISFCHKVRPDWDIEIGIHGDATCG
jgi:hypothetical protein